MELLLTKDVRKLGHVGDVVNVKAGYARNYLLPLGLATWPTEENLKAIESEKVAAAERRAAELRRFTEVADKLEGESVTIEANANEEGTLYGSVGKAEIAAALREKGHAVLADHVVLAHPIRSLDNVTVRLEFHDDVSVDVKVWVVREGGLPDAESEGEDSDESGDAADDES
ncbi:MAG: 50S ribosomal protein L9 [Phycisphaerales bacterium]|nr:50S ribosomal protein L9 [Phycisphaerales bacterium]